MVTDQKCLVTGSSGYVGSRIAAYLQNKGFEVVTTSRRRDESLSSNVLSFSFDQIPEVNTLSQFDSLVHCAWDMRITRWGEIERININSSVKLFENASKAGIKKIIFISSISAFEGCVSLYGKSKLLVEQKSVEFGVQCVRPGLVYGESAGGMVGKLSNSIATNRIIPVVGSSKRMLLVHEDDLSELVYRIIVSETTHTVAPIIAACSVPRSFKNILTTLAASQKRQICFIPIPWQPVWITLRILEILGITLGFKSDSLLGLAYPNPAPNFLTAQAFGVDFREFGDGPITDQAKTKRAQE